MSTPALLIERDGDRVDYLCEPYEYGEGTHSHVAIRCDVEAYRTEVGVTRFISDADVILRLRTGAFSYQNSMSPAEARLLALALSTAADEAEAA